LIKSHSYPFRTYTIERRLAICEALRADPDLRYVDLQAKFHAGSGTVRAAIKGGIDAWRQALGKAPAAAPAPPQASKPPAAKWEHACVAIRSSTSADGAVTYGATDEGDEAERDEEGGDAEPAGLSGFTTLAAALDAYGKLGWELAALVKVGKGDAEFTGAWEATFKRPVIAKR
jgi:hypothetical protein